MTRTMRCKPSDRLSELPDAVIFEIFWLMPMSDVVRTSVLSKRWRNLWTTTPFLNFDNYTMLFDGDRLWKFVNRALLSWNGTRVLKFRFHSCHMLVNSMFSDVDLWVSLAKRYGLEELSLHVRCNKAIGGDGKEEVYWVPPCLYSCSSLKKLTLYDCNLEIFGNVQWNLLESLKIECVRVTAHVINQILSATPQLRVFVLKYVERGENLSIQSVSLKELWIIKYVLSIKDLSVVSELRISTPNLETLEILGFPYSKCLLMNVSSLTRATIGIYGLQHWDREDLFSGKDFCGNTLSQILPTIQHVGNVRLLYCCTKVLGVMKMKCMHLSFPNVKSLELRCCSHNYEQVVGILEIFPQLERLVLKNKKGDDYQIEKEALIKFEANLPESFLLQLRTVEVTWAEGDGMFQLIEILLKCATKLEKIVFQLEVESPAPPPPSDSLYLVSQKLLRMRRSSTNCTIDLTKLGLQS